MASTSPLQVGMGPRRTPITRQPIHGRSGREGFDTIGALAGRPGSTAIAESPWLRGTRRTGPCETNIAFLFRHPHFGQTTRTRPAGLSSIRAVSVEVELPHQPFGEEPERLSRVGAFRGDQMVPDITDAFRAVGERRNQATVRDFPFCQQR